MACPPDEPGLTAVAAQAFSAAQLFIERAEASGAPLRLLGHPEPAIARAEETVREAADMDHSLTFAVATIWAVSVFLWTGQLDRAEDHIER